MNQESNSETPIKKRGRKKKSEIFESTPKTLNNANSNASFANPEFLDINKSIKNEKTSIKTEEIEENLSNTFVQNEEEEVILKPTPKRKRGRPSKKESTETSMLEITINEDIDKNETPRRSIRSRRIEKINDEIDYDPLADESILGNSETEEKEHIPKKTRKKRVGRPSKHLIEDTLFDPNDSSINGIIKCAKCQEEMNKENFINHNLNKHYLLSWYEGSPPIDIYDENRVVSLLWKALKRGIKSFHCEVCQTVKKSAVGFWSHLCVCSKSEEELANFKVKCELCDSYLLPCSLKVHMKQSHTDPKPKTENELIMEKTARLSAKKAKTKLQEFISTEKIGDLIVKKKNLKMMYTLKINEVTSRLIGQWKSHLKRYKFIKCKHIGCAFITQVLDEMLNHFNSCEFRKDKKNKFSCNFCKKTFYSEDEIIEHLKSEHSEITQDEIQNADEYNVSEGEVVEEIEKNENDMAKLLMSKKYQMPLRFKKRFCFLLREKLATSVNYTPALKWTMEFITTNYQDLLFNDLMIHELPLVPFEEHKKYLPETKKSIHFSRLLMENKILDKTQEKLKWDTMELFEGRLEDNISTFFTGGPIWAMAWCPLPVRCLLAENDQDQFLAVAVYSSMDQSTPIHPNVSFPGLIQIWNVGPIYHLELKRAPKLAFGLAHDFGLVHALAWCPSGAFQPPDRLGLLAAACSDGFIYIFSIPYRTESETTLYLAKPVKVLQADCEIVDSQCLCLAWYKGKGHHLIAGGFSNGMVALWRLDTTCQLFEDSPTLLPTKFFPAHTRAVNCIDFVTQTDVRYILTTSYDCSLCFWDLDNLENPVWSNKLRGFAVSAKWITHWFTAVCTFDEAYNLLSNTSLVSPRNFSFQPTPFLCQNSVCWTTSFNDWVNALVQCTLAGELMVAYPKHVVALDNDRVFKKYRFPLSYSEVVRVDGKMDTLKLDQLKKQTKEDESHVNLETKSLGRPGTYKELQETGHGLLINDFPFEDFTKLPPESLKWLRNFEELRCVPPDLYPLTSINRVSWNPNLNSYYWLAEGRQCGLLRIVCISGAGPTNSFKLCQDNYIKNYFPTQDSKNKNT